MIRRRQVNYESDAYPHHQPTCQIAMPPRRATRNNREMSDEH
ncbi:hypothetical protein LINGRAHAP2_LOCUS1649, partial [Linum grandiflorum]